MAPDAPARGLTPAAALARLGYRAVAPATLLRDGPVSRSYRVELAGAGPAVLRIDRRKPGAGGTIAAALGLDRGGEHRLLAFLAPVGLAPAPLAVDAAAGLSLRAFVAGPTWAEGRCPALPIAARALARIHRAPLPAGLLPVRDWRATLRRYAALAGPAGEGDHADAGARLADLPPVRAAEAVTCHHDPLPQNVVRRGGVFLDWEYAAFGNPLFDLAVLGHGLGLGGGRWSQLLDAYADAGGRLPRAVDAAVLGAYAGFAGAVARLWVRAVTDSSC